MLYTMADATTDANATVYLLSIRHHRQLSFEFAKLDARIKKLEQDSKK